METEQVKAKIAVGVNGAGVVLEVIETNTLFNTDLDSYGDFIEELFQDGTEPPKEAGIYLFEGTTHRQFQDEWNHHGTFTKLMTA